MARRTRSIIWQNFVGTIAVDTLGIIFKIGTKHHYCYQAPFSFRAANIRKDEIAPNKNYIFIHY